MTRVYIRHVRAAGFCVSGLGIWAKHRGFSMREFLKDGMDAEDLRKLNDSMVNRAIELAEEEERGR